MTPRWAARLPAGRTILVDTVLAVLLAIVAYAVPLSADDADFGSAVARPSHIAGWLVLAGAAWAVPFRRVRPMAAILVGTALQLTVWTLGYPDTFVSSAVLLYSAAAYGRAALRPLVWGLAALQTAYTGLGVVVADAPLYALPLVGLFAAAAVAFGSTASARQAFAEAAEARALELERSRQADRDRALAEERARIARELHDVVAHGLSVIVVQAAAARRILERDPDGAATALGQIESTGRNALGEMRHVLSAIRTEPEDSWQPTRGLADLEAMVAELAQAGLPVQVERDQADHEGRPIEESPSDTDAGPELEPLPATVDVTAYRIVQESLTNVLKHGGAGAEARVEITRRPGQLDLRITDNGQGALADDGGGHGLRGIEERVDVFGGQFWAGPRLGGGYTVEVKLPFEVRANTSTGVE